MKIKSDFVTNSSSSSYILAMDEPTLDMFNQFIENFTGGAITFRPNQSFDQLVEDMAMSEENQADCEDEISQGKQVFYLDVSDELGYGLIECTVFSKNIVYREGY